MLCLEVKQIALKVEIMVENIIHQKYDTNIIRDVSFNILLSAKVFIYHNLVTEKKNPCGTQNTVWRVVNENRKLTVFYYRKSLING